ncbi:MAG TPA: aconitate hydratase AcnA [Alphaproteobacteria bacterium]|nr:aconitate hydratase AcnA [Alphaproteobacteria bacterium]
MPAIGQDTLKTRRTLEVGGKRYDYFSLEAAAKAGLGDIGRLPFSLKVLLENLLRREDGRTVTVDDIRAMAAWVAARRSEREIAYLPARVLMQDFTGVPAIVDLAAMRDAMTKLGGDARKINPLAPVDLVIDHSVMVDFFGSKDAFKKNVEMEFKRNQERYEFLRWGQMAFDQFRVVPPGTGICHQVNLEYLAQTVWVSETSGAAVAYPDTLVGTDSHTTMVNGLAVLGWGVGGIEAEAAMLGQPISMVIPEVVGFKLTGQLREGATATDLVLTVTQMLRKKGVVGKFVEFYGKGLDGLGLADRATIGNMAPEYGATCGIFPIDAETIRYLRFTGRDEARVKLVEAYAKAQGLWRDGTTPDPVFSDTIELDLGAVEPSIAGPKRPQDRVALSGAAKAFNDAALKDFVGEAGRAKSVPVAGENYALKDGDVVIAAITSCTNTSNPSVLVGAGLLARNANAKGLKVKPWVKTSLAPGSQVVTDYLVAAGLQDELDKLGFDLVGYGCTTCIGNSGPLPEPIAAAIEDGDLVCAAVLSGNRNFEGRINPLTRANYLASPPLVVAYALAGSMKLDLLKDPLGEGKDGKPVYLKDIWPSNREITATIEKVLTPAMFRKRYANVFEGPEPWRRIKVKPSLTYAWDDRSTYIAHPPYFEDMPKEPGKLDDIEGARPLGLLGDSITTDHISPAGSIKKDSPAGEYLIGYQVRPVDFNSYGSRRGNHQVMMRGTFANIRIRNEVVPGVEGGMTKHLPDGKVMPIYDAAMLYQKEGVPLVIIAGKEYGTGSSRDWAAKGTLLLGVKAVIAESFERIHRSNLVGMGVMPLQFQDGTTRKTLKLDGSERFDILGIAQGLKPRSQLTCRIHRGDGAVEEIKLLCRIDTLDELEYYRHGGILHFVLRNLAKAK